MIVEWLIVGTIQFIFALIMLILVIATMVGIARSALSPGPKTIGDRSAELAVGGFILWVEAILAAGLGYAIAVYWSAQ